MKHQNKNTLINNNTTKTTKNVKEKPQTRIKNWSVYNDGLCSRGSFLELARLAIKEAEKELARRLPRKVGRPKKYPDAIILTIACFREIFNLTYRESEDFARDVFRNFGVSVPDYSTIERRIGDLNIDSIIKNNIDYRRLKGSVAAMVDSTGFKVSGEGEWKVRKHGVSKRRAWTKAHFLADFNSEQVLGVSVTADYIGDNLEVSNLLDNLPDKIRIKIAELLGDGAYNTAALYKFLEDDNDIRLVSPPAKNSKPNPKLDKGKRNHDVKRCIEVGQEQWKKENNYHRRSMIENTVHRIKTSLSDKLKSKTIKNQTSEIKIRIYLMNYWTNKWMPKYTRQSAKHKTKP